MLSFDDLLSPIGLDEFTNDYFEALPLHVQRGSGFSYSRLPNLSDFERIVRQGLLRPSDLRFAQRQESQSSGIAANPSPADAFAAFRAFQQGASFVFDRIERHFPVVQRMCREVEREFRHPVTANAVVTPGSAAQGFDLHFDFQDVFVLQLHGAKRWLVYSPLVSLPLPEQFRFPLSRVEVGLPILDIVLQPGDLLYVPRGFPHEAMTLETESLQIGLGLFSYTFTDAVEENIRRLENNTEWLREAVGSDILSLVAVKEPNQTALNAWNSLTWTETANTSVSLENRWKAWAKPCPPDELSAVSDVFQFVPSRVYRKADPTLWRMKSVGETLIVSAPGFCWTRSVCEREIFKFILSNESISIGDIPLEHQASALGILRELACLGVLIAMSDIQVGDAQ